MTFYKRRADISVSADKEGGPSGRNAVLGIFYIKDKRDFQFVQFL